MSKEPTLLKDPTNPADQSGQSGNGSGDDISRARSNESELRRLEEELAQLGREAMEQGGLREPGDYAEFLARREYLEERIHILRQLDTRGRPQGEDDDVGIGQRVTIQTDDGAEETWQIVSPTAARPREGLISDRSPLGRALIGRRAGEVVEVTSPEGSYTVTVLRVESPA
jgi:transcription elongation factor GreA